jgi:UrcA family protein
LLFFALFLSACVPSREVGRVPPDMVVSYADLALDTQAGQTELMQRADRAVRYFCAAYDPEADNAIFDVRLASTKLCPGAASLMLVGKMPARVRRAYRAGIREKRDKP